MGELNELDKKILEELQKDGRKSYTKLAEMFNANVTTVSNRVQRLIDNGTLKIVGVVSPFKTGNSFVADIKIRTTLSKLQSVIDQLTFLKEVRFLAACTGKYDLIIEVYASSNSELYEIIKDKISQIDGIIEIESSILLKFYKQSYDFGVEI